MFVCKISREFKTAVKLHSEPSYRIAQKAGIDPATLSKIICGILPARRDDSRILAVARVVGLPLEKCFED
jgi:hypothetical protein